MGGKVKVIKMAKREKKKKKNADSLSIEELKKQ